MKEHQIELCGLAERLKLYAGKVDELMRQEREAGRSPDPDMGLMWSDLTTSEAIINHLIRIKDEYL
jgi:hypothetical protein